MGAAHTDVGRVRSVNQDAALVSERLGLFAVADGMGGHRGGEIASEVAVATLRAAHASAEGWLSSADAVVDAVLDANEAVFEHARSDPDLFGMGTTLCVVALVGDGDEPDHVVVANVGDSRVYVLADGELVQVTEDHSLVADMVRGGHLSPAEAVNHPKRNIVTRALGIEPDVAVDYWERPLAPGERYLLCSDGLFNEVTEARIAATLRQVADPGQAARELVQLANAAGGRDNVTCLVVDVVDPGDAGDVVGAARAGTARARVGGPAATGGDGGTGAGLVAGRDDGADALPTAAQALAEALAAPAEADGPPVHRPKRLTFRLVAFIVALAAVGGAAYIAVRTFARNNYFVALSGENVAIYRGRPGGVLWFEPEVARPTTIRAADLTRFQLGKLDDPYQTSSLEDAERWVEQQLAPPPTTPTQQPTTPTSSAPPSSAGSTSSTPVPPVAPTAPGPSEPSTGTPPPAPPSTGAAAPRAGARSAPAGGTV